MRNTIKFRFAGIGIMLATAAVFGAAVMLLWNALMPQLFALPRIGYPQAAGLLVLARVLFGGIGGGLRERAIGRGRGEGHLFERGNKLREKWMGMSEEDRKAFIEKEKDFFRLNRDPGRFRDFFGDGERPEAGR